MAQRRNLSQSQQSWTDDLPLCEMCGVGTASNCVYGAEGASSQTHPYEDAHIRFRGEDSCSLYGVFNGYDGSKVASFASQFLTAELLLGQLASADSDSEVRRILTQAFDVVEKSYFESIDDALAEKAHLSNFLPHDGSQKVQERLQELEQEVCGGATAVVALILNNKLYIANMGTDRALLCRSSSDGQNQVLQIGRAHSTDNEDELHRLAALGLDSALIRQAGQIAGHRSTRRLGDYRAKIHYSDTHLLSSAKSKPVIAEPEVHTQSLERVSGFLLLMSEGLISALECAHGPEQANQEMVAMVAAELAQQSTLEAAAQSVVERVKRVHQHVYVSGRQRAPLCGQHEDMTLLIRCINYPGADPPTPTQGGRIYPVSVPYSNSNSLSTSKTSVTLSLVMPSISTMTNGTNTTSALEDKTPTPGQSPTTTLQSTNTQTQSSSSSSGDGSLFRQRGSQAAQPDETGRVPPYVDFSHFYRLWGQEHAELPSELSVGQGGLGPHSVAISRPVPVCPWSAALLRGKEGEERGGPSGAPPLAPRVSFHLLPRAQPQRPGRDEDVRGQHNQRRSYCIWRTARISSGAQRITEAERGGPFPSILFPTSHTLPLLCCKHPEEEASEPLLILCSYCRSDARAYPGSGPDQALILPPLPAGRWAHRELRWDKMRRHRVFLLCTVGLCVISFLHYYKALHYVSLRELTAPYPFKSFILTTGFFWRERGLASTPLSPASPEDPVQQQQHQQQPQRVEPRAEVVSPKASLGIQGVAVGEAGEVVSVGLEVRLEEQPAPPRPWERPVEGQDRQQEVSSERPVPTPPKHGGLLFPKDATWDAVGAMGDLHKRPIQLQDDSTLFFAHTKAGALCFRQGTEVATPKEPAGKTGGGASGGAVVNGAVESTGAAQRKLAQVQSSKTPKAKGRGRAAGKRLVKCVCRPGWHGPYCGVPTMVYHSNLPTKERLTPRQIPRRVINAININHEFDLLHARFHELSQAVDLFIVCESNFTAYGERRPLGFLQRLLNGTYDYVRHKLLYVFLDHFPDGGRQDGWIADDYLRTFLTRNGMSRVQGLRPDDVFVINDADEIPAREGLLFLKLFDGWTEPFALHMRKSLYGFFWKQFGSLEVISGCTVGMLRDVYDCDGIKLRRREYYTMPGFRRYENDTGHILVQWSLGSPIHFAGWHCSWCFSPEGIYFKLISAQNGDFPRWGDYEDKRDLNYIRQLIRTGGWFDGSLQEYPPADPKEHMFAPHYMLDHYERYRYLLENPYIQKQQGAGE
uniref:PPM-type phosphatase domain-containing protein n=1 Tax=Knipowitschia caucasica TaxID=637954 RepID=A0AAV2LM49_KNICA